MPATNVTPLRAPRTRTQGVKQLVSFDNIYEMCAYVRSAIIDSRKPYKEIAAKAGVWPTTVSKIASGETKDPRGNTMIRVLFACGKKIYGD